MAIEGASKTDDDDLDREKKTSIVKNCASDRILLRNDGKILTIKRETTFGKAIKQNCIVCVEQFRKGTRDRN